MPSVSQPSSSTPPQATPTLHPSAQRTPEFPPTNTDEFQSTATMLATFALVESPLPANATCSPAEITQYLNVVSPLADEHTVDTYEAQKMEEITDETHIAALRQRASVRLESLQIIQAPPCLLEAHEKMTESFELLISTWDLIETKDFTTATTTLQKCYEVLADAIATIVMVQQK